MLVLEIVKDLEGKVLIVGRVGPVYAMRFETVSQSGGLRSCWGSIDSHYRLEPLRYAPTHSSWRAETQ